MGSIPLVALNAQAPQQPDILQKYGQLAQLKAMQQQSQLQQQEAPLRLQALQQNAQAGQIDLAQKQQGQKDQSAITAALQEYDGKDINALPALVIKNGGSAQAVFGLKKTIGEQQKQAADLFKTQADAGKATVETIKQKSDLIAGALDGLKDVPDAQLPQATAGVINDLVQKQLMDPQSAQKAMQLVQSGDPAAIRQGVDQFSKTLLTHTQIIDQAHKKALEDNEKATRDQAALNAKETARHNNVEEGLGKARVGAEYARLNFDKQKQNFDADASIDAIAQQIASGDVKPPSLSRSNPRNAAIMARVYELNPKYSDSLYTSTQDLRSSKPNSMGANVGRLGTAILHADNALKNSHELGFSEGLLTGVGTEGTSRYKQDAEFLTGEIGQFVTGGKLTVDEGNKISKDLMSSRQSVRDSAIHEILELSGGKLKSTIQQYKNATQNEFPIDRVFNDPTISGALQKHGIINPPASKEGSFDWNAHPVAK